MAKRSYQTTFTFKSQNGAELFRDWLVRNVNDRDYGHPRFLDLRQVVEGWCVEYSADGDLAKGVATGIDLV